MKLWKFTCPEAEFPGIWHHWFELACVCVDYPPQLKFRLKDSTTGREGWKRTTVILKTLEPEDYVVVMLDSHCVSRLGVVTEKKVNDEEWNPIIPMSKINPHGRLGRRIQVNWIEKSGPTNRYMAVSLPNGTHLTRSEIKLSPVLVRSRSLSDILSALNNRANWVSLHRHLEYDQAVLRSIRDDPQRLEFGLSPYPTMRFQKLQFASQSETAAVFVDKKATPVLVVCVQGVPSTTSLKKIRRKMSLLKSHLGVMPRGILVYGGARLYGEEYKPVQSLIEQSLDPPRVEIIHYTFDVGFERQTQGWS